MKPSIKHETIYFEDQPVTIRPPAENGPSNLLLALHGLTGDEHAMEIFFRRIPASYRILSPSAPFSAVLGGRSWVEGERQAAPSLADFDQGLDWLLSLLEHARTLYAARNEIVHALGFSQGAAAGYALAINFPAEVRSIAALSGFLPRGAENSLLSHTLAGLPVFITHGTKDETIPVEAARHAVETLEQAGANVTYCEDEVGHKLSTNCFRSLAQFYKNL